MTGERGGWQDAPSIRLLHTSEQHLGHALRGEGTREHDHAAFLGWLVEICMPDTPVVTGVIA